MHVESWICNLCFVPCINVDCLLSSLHRSKLHSGLIYSTVLVKACVSSMKQTRANISRIASIGARPIIRPRARLRGVDVLDNLHFDAFIVIALLSCLDYNRPNSVEVWNNVLRLL